MQNQKAAVDSGRWLLYRYHPDLIQQGKNPLQLDSRTPKLPIEESMYRENRFKMLTKINPTVAKQLLQEAQNDVNTRWQMYQYLAARQVVNAANNPSKLNDKNVSNSEGVGV
jgi:pyruvate-ferredoxin/flavodoxin oxidoreductase